jgi:CelD/BcsL family acetyltransferase involved in cellulose biosynthesis
MKIDVFADFDSELEKKWREFETEAFLTPFQSFEWLSHWQNIIGKPLHSVQPQVVIVKEKEKLMAIFPLGIWKSMGVFILEWLGGSQSDYMGPLLSEKWESMEKDFPICWQNVLDKL